MLQTVVSKTNHPPPGMAGPTGLRGLACSRLGFRQILGSEPLSPMTQAW